MKSSEKLFATMSDAQLIALVVSGDRAAFDALMLRHKNHLQIYLHGQLRNVEAEKDVAQDVWEAVWRCFVNGHYREEKLFEHWLNTIAHHAVEMWRRKDSVFIHDDLLLLQQADDVPAVDDRVMEKERKRALRRAVDSLGETMKKVVMLRIDEGADFKTIGERLHIKTQTATKVFARAKMILKSFLGNRDGVL